MGESNPGWPHFQCVTVIQYNILFGMTIMAGSVTE